MIKLSTQKETLKQLNLIIKKIISDSVEIEKIDVNLSTQNNRLVTRIEIISKT